MKNEDADEYKIHSQIYNANNQFLCKVNKKLTLIQ